MSQLIHDKLGPPCCKMYQQCVRSYFTLLNTEDSFVWWEALFWKINLMKIAPRGFFSCSKDVFLYYTTIVVFGVNKIKDDKCQYRWMTKLFLLLVNMPQGENILWSPEQPKEFGMVSVSFLPKEVMKRAIRTIFDTLTTCFCSTTNIVVFVVIN